MIRVDAGSARASPLGAELGTVLAAVLAVVLTATLAGCGAGPGAVPPADLQVGVLATTCAPDRAADLARAGIRRAVLDIAWDRYEPRPGEFDPAYAAQVRDRVETCTRSGIALVLGPGLQYPPDWVLALPAGTYRDGAGETPAAPVANLVFSRPVRDAATAYLHRLQADLGLARFAGIRIGTTRTGELGYPDPGPTSAFWAFDAAAQGGPDLAAGADPSPLPGWVPGDPAWRGAPVTTDQTTTWFRWYVDSAVDGLRWQVDVLRGLGFAGDLHVPVAGRGVLPADLDDALAHQLARPDRTGAVGDALGRGLDYPAQFAALARLDAADGPGRLVVDFTGLDDISAVRARGFFPAKDGCRASDEQAVRDGDGDVAFWSAQRFTTAVARLSGLGLVGENPGGPGLAYTGGRPDSDALDAQLRYAPRYAQECGLTQFYWAFEDSLYDDRSGVRMADLEELAHRSD